MLGFKPSNSPSFGLVRAPIEDDYQPYQPPVYQPPVYQPSVYVPAPVIVTSPNFIDPALNGGNEPVLYPIDHVVDPQTGVVIWQANPNAGTGSVSVNPNPTAVTATATQDVVPQAAGAIGIVDKIKQHPVIALGAVAVIVYALNNSKR